jgi:hypothetical protein
MRQSMEQKRRLAHRGVGAGNGGQQVEATLINEEQRAMLGQGLIF